MMTNRLRHKENGIFHFLRFFAVFTSIFVVMTVIILQIILSGAYTAIDKALLNATEDTTFYVRKSLSVAAIEKESGKELPISFRLKGELMANTDVLVHDASGLLLNNVAAFSSLQYLPFNTVSLNKLVTQKVQNVSGQEEVYRLITVKVSDWVYPEAAYLSIAINTTQVEEVNQRHVRIISSVMFVFWLLSMGASLYLAKWSRKPIIENYQRQKTFVENASHELRTPLAVLQNRLELLFRKPDSSILDNSENIASSLDEVRNMRVLTTNLLELARRDDGITLNKKELSPSFFKDIFANYQLIAEEQGKLFYYSCELQDIVSTDPTLIKQIMTILFDNAIKYTGDDGEIFFRVSKMDKYLYLNIRDNGYGIKDEEKDKIFERFYRIDKARTRQKGGFGLGLSLAKQMIDALDGTITVTDNQPKGAIFEVKLMV